MYRLITINKPLQLPLPMKDMKYKSRIKLYQIKLIGHNFKFNKTVIGFKSYSRVCRCSSQVYFGILSKQLPHTEWPLPHVQSLTLSLHVEKSNLIGRIETEFTNTSKNKSSSQDLLMSKLRLGIVD